MERIFHITDAVSWRASRWEGYLGGDTLERDGYLHFSLRSQVERVANARYRGQRDLVVLEVDPLLADAPVRMELAEDGEQFPHLYGPLAVGAVMRVHELRPNPDGSFAFR
ncbi:MAG TPA: DUF952 domain-containing protein [Mycobacteriales bacterium]|nr:DUF952 domain-containing protein [Mycobacteriales bacterium]